MIDFTTWNPFDELTNLHREMDRVFNRRWPEGGSQDASTQRAWVPASEVAAEGDGYRLRLALPGVNPDEVDIELHGNTLTVRGERRTEKAEGEQRRQSEFSYGAFERTFTLPSTIDGEKVKASHRFGMLELFVPLAESAKPKRIEIASGDRDGVARIAS